MASYVNLTKGQTQWYLLNMKKIYRWGRCAVWQTGWTGSDAKWPFHFEDTFVFLMLLSCHFSKTLFIEKCSLTFKAFIEETCSGGKARRLWNLNLHANIFFWKMGKILFTSQDAMRIKWGNIQSLECCEYVVTIFLSFPFLWPFLIPYMTSRVFFSCSHTPNPPKPWLKLTSYTKLLFVLI